MTENTRVSEPNEGRWWPFQEYQSSLSGYHLDLGALVVQRPNLRTHFV